MTRDEAKEAIKYRVSCRDLLGSLKNNHGNCPFCGSGTRKNGTGALTFYPDTNTFYCFSCEEGGDVLKLYQQIKGVDYNAALQQLAEREGITIDPYKAKHTTSRLEAPTTAIVQQGHTDIAPANKTTQEPLQGLVADYVDYYLECRERLTDPEATSYLSARGISLDVARAFLIGYDPKADPAGANHPAPRLIIPTSRQHYIGRATDPATPAKYAKMNVKGSKPGIFNSRALNTEELTEIFVTEGAFDAMAITEALTEMEGNSAAAIALNSTSNAGQMLKRLETKRIDATFVLCLDNDEAGKKATEVLRTGLQRLNIAYVVADITGQYKDPNDFLVADRAAFTAAIQTVIGKTKDRPDGMATYMAEFMGAEIEAFRADLKTGFSNLDKLSGGLYSGLYVVAAISSLGKTTFVHQMADQIAAAGNDVLYFSLEQSRLEMATKGIARLTAQNDMETAVTSLSIRRGQTVGLPQTRTAIVQYAEMVENRLSVIEGNFNCNITFIGDYIRQFISRNNTRPVVIIDYLQILQPETTNGRIQTTRETVDSTVTAMKRLSREQGLTVIAICSVNRSNYLTPIDFESLKESGGIEYTADVVWGLQLSCVSEELFRGDSSSLKTEKRERVKQAKEENPRKIDLVCLKNRYGVASYSCSYLYYPANDLFVETEKDDTVLLWPSHKKAGRKPPIKKG